MRVIPYHFFQLESQCTKPPANTVQQRRHTSAQRMHEHEDNEFLILKGCGQSKEECFWVEKFRLSAKFICCYALFSHRHCCETLWVSGETPRQDSGPSPPNRNSGPTRRKIPCPGAPTPSGQVASTFVLHSPIMMGPIASSPSWN